MSPFEIGMLICFGASWPLSIAKALRTHQVAGKSPLFLFIILLGYVCGMAHKLIYRWDHVFWLYLLNFVLVGTDLALYFYYSKKQSNTTR